MKNIWIFLLKLFFLLPISTFGQISDGVPMIDYDCSSSGNIRGNFKILSITKSVFKNGSLYHVDTISTNEINDSICYLQSEMLINSLKIEGKEFIFSNSNFYLYEIFINFNRLIKIFSNSNINIVDHFMLEILKKK